MKELLLQVNNERGMFLPFVLFITIILFSVITTGILIYKNETKISYQLWEQMKAETIVQMVEQQFKNDKVYEGGEEGMITFSFPSGEAKVTYVEEENSVYHLTIKIRTDYDESFLLKHIVRI